MPTAHETMEYLLPDYASGVLTGADANALAEHLKSCPTCMHQLASMNAAVAVLNESTPSVPEGYFQTIIPRFRARLGETSKRKPDWIFEWARLLAPVGAAVVAVGLLTTVSLGPAGNDQNGLRALADEIGSNEFAEIVLDEMQGAVLGSVSQDVAALAVPQNSIARQLLEQMAGEHVLEELAPLQTVEDLETDELDLILRRLEQRKFL